MSTIDAIRARLGAASGPFTLVRQPGAVTIWAGEADPHGGFPRDTPVCTFHNRTPGGGHGDPQMVADARFIAASYADVRDLLAEVDRLRAALALLVADAWAGWHWDEGLCAHYCVLCGERGPGVAAAPRHGAACPYVAARAALAWADGRTGGDREGGGEGSTDG